MELLLIALSSLISEDLACVAAGVLIAQGKLGWASGILACFAGISFGDLLLFLAGRVGGRRAMRWRVFRKTLPEGAVDRASGWLSQRGMAVVFLSRFAPGLRLPTYFAAGVLKTSFRSFALYFLCAAAVWTPLLVGGSAILGDRVLRSALQGAGTAVPAAAAGLTALLALRYVSRLLFNRRARRLLAGFFKRKIRWEFWPAWAAYMPLAPYLIYLAVRHRSLTLFTAANPGIPTGGFAGESKSAILRHLASIPGLVPRFAVIPQSASVYARLQLARSFMADNRLEYPVVLKPDFGERGTGVRIVRSEPELSAYFGAARTDTILQRYISGMEFGVFYVRRPGETTGRILSLTHKCFPSVIGDGRSTLENLILDDDRAVCMARAYFAAAQRPLDAIPAAGESVKLVEIGSHCRGSVFLDAQRLITPQLTEAAGRAAKAHPGFYLGRFDVRTPSVEALQAGIFQVLELNGVTAEPTHIYDPAVSIRPAYRALASQWRMAFEIGAVNRMLGAQPMRLTDFLGLVWKRLRGTETAPSLVYQAEAGS
jgi:membrane protein DedA with SNARE-associated domain